MTTPINDPSTQVITELKRLYFERIRPLEEQYLFHEFHSPLMSESDFDSNPHVLLIGQYSTGKTSFIRYLLGRDFPGLRVGPEPTTDRFTVVMHGQDERTIPGNALAVQANLPYKGLERFGNGFLTRLEASQLPSPVLENITLVDTPGVLSGEKQRQNRGYDFLEVCSWFAERSDLILLLFDAHKLDISDEFRAVIESLRGHDDKIRLVLNKADQVDRQKLMRVYGALMWSMGKVLNTPEVVRVFVGSFWDQPLRYEDNAELFTAEESDLMSDLRSLPRNSAVRKINELVKRTRLARVHAHIIGHLKASMPMTGKQKKQDAMMANMGEEFRKVVSQHNLPPGDFPNLEHFVGVLRQREIRFSNLSKLKPRMIQAVSDVIEREIPRLMAMIPRGEAAPEELALDAVEAKVDEGAAGGNPFAAPPMSEDNPFAPQWPVEANKAAYDAAFAQANPTGGKLSGAAARPVLVGTGAPVEVLGRIWELSDVDGDGQLDGDEFALFMYLVDEYKAGNQPPASLPSELVPPSKR